MSQVDQLQAIDKLVRKTKPNGVVVQKLINDWNAWYPNLSWAQKNLSNDIITQALEFRSALESALTGKQPSSMGASNYSKPGTFVPAPAGYRRATAKEISPKVQSFAASSLSKLSTISKKSGQAATIGKQYSGVVNGKQYLAQSEWHFDNHPKGGGPAFWHFGVSIYVPSNPTPAPSNSPHYTASLFNTSDPSLKQFQTDNPYA